jgi:hypothetical protein
MTEASMDLGADPIQTFVECDAAVDLDRADLGPALDDPARDDRPTAHP